MNQIQLFKAFSATILSGAAVTEEVDIDKGYVLTGIQIPAAWTAADIVVETTGVVQKGSTTWFPILDVAGSRLRCSGVPTALACIISLTGMDLAPWRYLRLRSVGVGLTTDLNQGADRAVKLIVKSA